MPVKPAVSLGFSGALPRPGVCRARQRRSSSLVTVAAGSPQVHVASLLSTRNVVIAAVVLAGFVLLLALPVLYDRAFNAFSSGVHRASKGTFFAGMGVLAVGLVAGIRVIDIIGIGVMVAVVVGVIIDQYLIQHRAGSAQRAELADQVTQGAQEHSGRRRAAGDVQRLQQVAPLAGAAPPRPRRVRASSMTCAPTALPSPPAHPSWPRATRHAPRAACHESS